MAVDQPGSSVLDHVLMREAAHWVEQLYSDEINDASFSAWLRWLEDSESNTQVYWRMAELWQLLGSADSDGIEPPDQKRAR